MTQLIIYLAILIGLLTSANSGVYAYIHEQLYTACTQQASVQACEKIEDIFGVAYETFNIPLPEPATP